jgi:hypothetical protein
MSFPRLRFPHILPFALLAGAALVPAGCGTEEGVTKTQVPKTTEPSRPGPAEPAAGGYRILGAMFPTDQPGWYWYFKFVGSSDKIGAQEAAFDKLIRSVRLQADTAKLPSFDAPDGWTRTGPRVDNRAGVEVRFDEVLKVDGLECTVSHVGGGKEFNLNRWAGQVGAAPGDTAKAVTEFDAGGVKALRVDLRGPKDPSAQRGGPFMGGKLPPNHP